MRVIRRGRVRGHLGSSRLVIGKIKESSLKGCIILDVFHRFGLLCKVSLLVNLVGKILTRCMDRVGLNVHQFSLLWDVRLFVCLVSKDKLLLKGETG